MRTANAIGIETILAIEPPLAAWGSRRRWRTPKRKRQEAGQDMPALRNTASPEPSGRCRFPSPPLRAPVDDWIDEQVLEETAMKRLPGILVLMLALAWVAPAPAQLFAKKPKVNPT